MKFQGKTIQKNKNSDTWYTRYRLNGKQYYISAKTQKDCYNKLKKALNIADKQIISIPAIKKENTLTLIEWYNQWLMLYKSKRKESTIRGYKTSLNNLKPILDKNIKLITIEDVLNILNSNNAERQKQKDYELLNSLFKKALDHEKIDKNIMTKIDKPEHIKKNGKALTHNEEEKFINECKKIKYGDFYLVALYQGLRKGECLGITGKDIDFENNTLNIDKAINIHNKFDTTKNIVSVRKMPLFEKTKEILLKYKNIESRIFDISYHRIDDHTKNLKESLGFDFSIKFLRYTFITRCQEQNIPEFITQSWCGHRIGSKVTRSVYTKYNAEDNNKYINILNNSKFYSNSTQKK